MKRSSNITVWQLRLFEALDKDIMVMQRDEQEVFDHAIHVFFEKSYYDTYLAKAKKYSDHRYAYHEDKLGEVIYQIFDEDIEGLVLHMSTQEQGLCEEKYLAKKDLLTIRGIADSYHHLFMASIERMPKEQAIARLWTKWVYIIGQLPDPTKKGEQRVELMTMRRKADGSLATPEDFDHESVKVFLTPESAMRFNPDKKPVNRYKLAMVASFVRGKAQIVLEPHRNYWVEFDPANLDLSTYLDVPGWSEEKVKERIKQFAKLEECYVLLAPQIADYKLAISAPFLIRLDENNLMLNVFEKYDDAVEYCIANSLILPARDGVYPIGRIEKKDPIHSFATLIAIAQQMGVQGINLDMDTQKSIGCKLQFLIDAAGLETDLEVLLSEDDLARVRAVQDEKTMYRFPIFPMVDADNEFELSKERKAQIIKHMDEDADHGLAFVSTCSLIEVMFALNEIGNRFEAARKEDNDAKIKLQTVLLNMFTVVLTERLLDKPYAFTLRNDDNSFTLKNDMAYLIVTDRYENARKQEGKLTLVSVDNENFMQKLSEAAKVAIVTDGPTAICLADIHIMTEVSKQRKKVEAIKEDVIIYLTQALNLSYVEADLAYRRLSTDNSVFVEFLTCIRNGEYAPAGLISINGYTARRLALENNLNPLQAYDALLEMKLHPQHNPNEVLKTEEKEVEKASFDVSGSEEKEEKKSFFGKLFKK